MYSNKNIPTFQDCIASLQLSRITQRTRRGQTVESQNETSCLLDRSIKNNQLIVIGIDTVS